MNRFFYLMLLNVIFIVSCSYTPKPISHQFSTQKKIQAAEHWEILAKDFAKQIASSAQIQGVSPSIYVQDNDVSDFGRAFRGYLITELFGLGCNIAYVPDGALNARWSVKKIYHKAERKASAFPATRTITSALGYGIYKIFDSSSPVVSSLLVTAGSIDLLDNMDLINKGMGGFSVTNNVPHTEIILGFTLSKEGKIFSRKTQAYYVNQEDFNHYANIVDHAGQKSSLKPVKFELRNN